MDRRFEDLVRSHAELGDGETFNPDDRLEDLGIRSLASIQLLVEIEDAYGVELPDELLMPATFETPATLWEAVKVAIEGHAPTGTP